MNKELIIMLALIMVIPTSIVISYAPSESFIGQDCDIYNREFNIKTCNDINYLLNNQIQGPQGEIGESGPKGDPGVIPEVISKIELVHASNGIDSINTTIQNFIDSKPKLTAIIDVDYITSSLIGSSISTITILIQYTETP